NRATADIYTLSLLAALPICQDAGSAAGFTAPVCSSATGAAATANVGTYTIDCLAGSADNYTLAAASFPNAFTVSKKALSYDATRWEDHGSKAQTWSAIGCRR